MVESVPQQLTYRARIDQCIIKIGVSGQELLAEEISILQIRKMCDVELELWGHVRQQYFFDHLYSEGQDRGVD